MATHSSSLAWRIPWTEEPGGLQSTGCTELGTAHKEAEGEHEGAGGRSTALGSTAPGRHPGASRSRESGGQRRQRTQPSLGAESSAACKSQLLVPTSS